MKNKMSIQRNDIFLKPKILINFKKINFPLFREIKQNGHRIAVVKDKNNRINILTPTLGVELIKDKKLKPPIWAYDLKPFTIIECEMVYPNHPAAEVPTAIKNFPNKLIFIPFAIPFHNGIDLRNYDYISMHNMIFLTTKHKIDYYSIKTKFDINLEIERAKRRNIEGFVYKEFGYKNWYKLKVDYTIDLKLIGFTSGKGKYSDTIGCIVLEDINKIKIQCAGITDELRRSLSSKDFNRIIEIKYNEITTNNKLQHPRFVQFRDDKSIPDSILDFKK